MGGVETADGREKEGGRLPGAHLRLFVGLCAILELCDSFIDDLGGVMRAG